MNNGIQVRLGERFNSGGESLIGQNDHGATVIASQLTGFNRHVETILHVFRSNDDSRAVTVTAIDRLHQIALFHTGGKAGTGAAALDVYDNQRQFRHAAVAERLPS